MATKTQVVVISADDWTTWLNAPLGGVRVLVPWAGGAARVVAMSPNLYFAQNRIALAIEGENIEADGRAVDAELVAVQGSEGVTLELQLRGSKPGREGLPGLRLLAGTDYP